MITLYTFGPALGLPDPSSFVTKAEILLKMAGVPYAKDRKGFGKAPKGKLPYIRDEEVVVSDSTFIRFYLEDRYGIDFNPGLSPAECGVAWAVEKMCEDHLYWLMVDERWMIDGNFERGPAQFFKAVPAPLRWLVQTTIRRRVRKTLHGQGEGRFTAAERARLAARAMAAIADVLGDRPYLMGAEPCGADATVFAFLQGALCPLFEGPLRSAAEASPGLVDYCHRLTARYYPGEEGA
ncbi:MAG TPA: glutathione S-transferase family protein [Telmatospirillum sp.]|nr:glutathione S-transferase family protein [Telmatospirillum sp.]